MESESTATAETGGEAAGAGIDFEAMLNGPSPEAVTEHPESTPTEATPTPESPEPPAET